MKRLLLPLPFVCLFLWFLLEPFGHIHPGALGAAGVVLAGMIYVLRVTLSGRFRVLALLLWCLIVVLAFVDFAQRVVYENYSRDHFAAQSAAAAEKVRTRAQRLLSALESESQQLQQALSVIDLSKLENLPIQMSRRLGQSSFWWGVYNEEGRLLTWNGEVRSSETYLPEGGRDVEVEGILHQQLLKLKRSVRIQGHLFFLSAYEPLAADYGIENQYLSTYNLLTDGLPIRPLLLYNSESSARSPDVIVQNVQVSPEFTISALFEKSRYQELLQSRTHILHWWLEFLTLAFFLCSSIYLTIEFASACVRAEEAKQSAWNWFLLLAVSLLSAMSVARFSAFGALSVFRTREFELPGFAQVFHTPGGFLCTALFALNLAFGLAVLLRTRSLRLRPGLGPLSFGLTAAMFIAAGKVLLSYMGFVGYVMSHSAFSVINYSMLGMTSGQLSLIFGILLLDLALVLSMGIVFRFVIDSVPRSRGSFLLLMLLSSLAVLPEVAWGNTSLPVIAAAGITSGLAALVYFLPRLKPRFVRSNPLSRFSVVLLAVWCVSGLFYLARFHYAMQLQESYIRDDAAQRVLGQQAAVQEMLKTSAAELDRALANLTLDPRIQDLPYRLWLRTEFARAGIRSGVELYNPDGRRLNSFLLRFPSLHNLDIVSMAEAERWNFGSMDISFGNIRKRVHIAVRRLANGGYVSLQAMEDAENLPFIPSTSPLQELFRPERKVGRYMDSLALCVYDASWHPAYVSDPDLVPSVEKARDLLRVRSDVWLEDNIGGREVRAYFFQYNHAAAALVIPTIALRTHLVQLIDLFLLNLSWLALCGIILHFFFPRAFSPQLASEAPVRISFYQKLLIAFLVFSMVPMLFLSYLIRHYVWEKKTVEVTSRALYSFSVASRVVNDYIFSQGNAFRGDIFSDDTLEWIGQVSQQDISVYFEGLLIGTSVRDFYGAGLLGDRLRGSAYADLFLEGRKYSIGESQIGRLSYLNVSGRVHRGRFKDEVISIPYLIDRRSVEEEIVGLREYMMLAGAGLILFAILIGWFLAGRFVRPVRVLIDGTGEMSRGNLTYRIGQSYRDEFQQLVSAFNTMANSIDEQQQTLERRRQYIENILNHITTAVISINSTMNIATVNPAAAEMLDVHPSERGLLGEVVMRPGAWPELGSAVQSFLAKPRELAMREVAEYRTNRELHFRLVYVPLFQQQEWAGAVLLVEDISDIIQSNRLAAFAEMARRVAHEVKNPLTPIQLAVEHLVRVYEDGSSELGPVLKSCSDVVLKQVKTLRQLVSEFSQYGRPASLNRVETDSGAFLTDIFRAYESHLGKGVRMQMELEPGLPRVRVDTEKVRGAVMNVLENALQAVNGEGMVTLRAARFDGYVEISVHDTGPGIPAEILPRLFEPYFSTKSGGTGLGLAIARKNIEDHGGRVTVETSPGDGTTVFILVPAVPSPGDVTRDV